MRVQHSLTTEGRGGPLDEDPAMPLLVPLGQSPLSGGPSLPLGAF
jgi:hypothetical protein